MKKRVLAVIITLLCVVVASASILALKKSAPTKAAAKLTSGRAPRPDNSTLAKRSTLSSRPQEDPTPTPTPENNVPEYIVYYFLFHHNNALLKKAAEAEAQGQDGSAMRDFYKREAGLDDTQASAFNQIAADCDAEVDAVDAQAKQVIAAYRAQFAGAPLPEGQTLPPPPAELAVLQQQRNNAIISARDRLQQALGTTAFDSFNTFVKENVMPQIKPQNMDGLRPVVPPGVQRPPAHDPYAAQ